MLDATGTAQRYRRLLETSETIFQFFINDRQFLDQKRDIELIAAECSSATETEKEALDLSNIAMKH